MCSSDLCLYAFCDLAHLAEDVVEVATLTEPEADPSIARQVSGAGKDQITHSREPQECGGVCPQPYAESRNFRESPGHDCSSRVVTLILTVSNSDRDRDHVLEIRRASCRERV